MYILHLSKRNFHFIAVRSSSVKLVNSSVCNSWRQNAVYLAWGTDAKPFMCCNYQFIIIIIIPVVTDRVAEWLFCHWASEAAGMQGAGVVREVYQQVKPCGDWKGLIPPWTQLVGAALQVLSHLKLTPGAETGERNQTDQGIVC